MFCSKNNGIPLFLYPSGEQFAPKLHSQCGIKNMTPLCRLITALVSGVGGMIIDRVNHIGGNPPAIIDQTGQRYSDLDTGNSALFL